MQRDLKKYKKDKEHSLNSYSTREIGVLKQEMRDAIFEKINWRLFHD